MGIEWHTPAMNFLKRIELWVLLAVIIAGLVWVFSSKHADDDESGTTGATSTADASDLPLKVYRCVIERDYGNARLDVDVRIRNDEAEKLICQSPKVKLLNAKGREVPSFFLPFDQQPEVPAKTAQDVQLRYWVDAADLQGALTLEVNGKTLEVKTAKALDWESMKNGEKRTLSAGAW